MNKKLWRTLSAIWITYTIVFVIGLGQVLNWMANQSPDIAVNIPWVLSAGIVLQFTLAFITEKCAQKLKGVL